MKSQFICLVSVVAGVLSEAPARANTLYSQLPNLNQFDIVDDRLADSFRLSSFGVLNHIVFWYQAQFQTDLTSVTYAIYQDNGGLPGSVVLTGTAAPTTSDQTNYFQASFLVPDTDLSAGTYWLELHGGSSLTDDNGGLTIWWEASDASYSPSALSSSFAVPDTPVALTGYNHYAFALLGPEVTVTPEPSTGVLWLAGFAGLAAGYRKRRTQ